VHDDPTHESEARFVAPEGVVLSGTWEIPPPSDRLPQMSRLSGIVPAVSRNVLPQLPPPAVDRKSNFVGTPPTVVVVVDDVEVEVELLVGALVDDEEDEVVVGAIVDDDVVADVDEVVVARVVDVDVVVGSMQVHTSEQVAPGAQVNAPPGDDGSQGSPSSTLPFPQVGWVVVVEVEVLVDVGRTDELDEVVVVKTVDGGS
jgi:hypothetical protein